MNGQNENSTADDMPLGFSFSLATNQNAMEKFASMTEPEKRQVIETARTIRSKQQMERFVDNIGEL